MSQATIDLHTLVIDKLNTLTDEDAGKFFRLGESAIKKMRAGTRIPDVRDVQRVFDLAFPEYLRNLGAGTSKSVFQQSPPQGTNIPPKDELLQPPKPQAEAVSESPAPPALDPIAEMRRSPFHLLMPTNRPINPYAMLSFLGNWKDTLPEEIKKMLAPLNMEVDTQLHHARNTLAMHFLKSEREWSIWFDSDQFLQFGNPAFFRRWTGGAKNIRDEFLIESAIRRLTKHGKSMVGGVYTERSEARTYLIAVEDEQRNPFTPGTFANELHTKGPQNRLMEVPWLAFGCVAIHRQVFLDIMEKCPNLAPKVEGRPWNFFTPFEGGPHGEDTTFCHWAREAGHQPMLDLGLFAGHIGNHCFMP